MACECLRSRPENLPMPLIPPPVHVLFALLTRPTIDLALRSEPGWMYDPAAGGFIRLPEPGWRYDSAAGGYVKLEEEEEEGELSPPHLGAYGNSPNVRGSAVISTLGLVVDQLRSTLSAGSDDNMIASALEGARDDGAPSVASNSGALISPGVTPRSRSSSTSSLATLGVAAPSKMAGWCSFGLDPSTPGLSTCLLLCFPCRCW